MQMDMIGEADRQVGVILIARTKALVVKICSFSITL